jgi:hypothetical protein
LSNAINSDGFCEIQEEDVSPSKKIKLIQKRSTISSTQRMPIKASHLASIKEQINPNIKSKSPTKQFTQVNQSSSQEDGTAIENSIAL